MADKVQKVCMTDDYTGRMFCRDIEPIKSPSVPVKKPETTPPPEQKADNQVVENEKAKKASEELQKIEQRRATTHFWEQPAYWDMKAGNRP